MQRVGILIHFPTHLKKIFLVIQKTAMLFFLLKNDSNEKLPNIKFRDIRCTFLSQKVSIESLNV